MNKLLASDIGLTKSVQTKIRNQQSIAVPFVDYIVQQPSFGGTEYTLEELSQWDIAFNQSPLNPRKVKDIITKTDTGLLKNDFYLFNPIFLGSVRGDEGKKYVISGRHRLAAIFIIAEICGFNFSETKLEVLELTFDSVDLLAISISAYNTNRTMTKPERERVVLAADMAGKTPILQNISGNVGTATKCAKFFKQIVYNTIIKNTNQDEHKRLLTEYTVYKISTYWWKLLTEDEVIQLKTIKEGAWESIVSKVMKFVQEGKFYKPNYNISRDKEALENMALELYTL
ncbi:MAG: hypothetical protein R3321_00265 [Nitrososphaeraceae archaeon]|nr:hypothetical protein [Nitrososphaeraceae archaeon]